MRLHFLSLLSCLAFLFLFVSSANAQYDLGTSAVTGAEKKDNSEFIYGDLLPDAPELSKRGNYHVGVQTINLLHKNQLDILHYKDSVVPKYNRTLKVEVWYPAIIPANKKEMEVYHELMGNKGDIKRPLIPFSFKGRCLRNANPDRSAGAFPLIILSHGFTGSRLLFTYLAENLASKGYVVASIGHTESTFEDAANFSSTLLNRSLDQLFVLDEMDRLSQAQSKSFLSGLADASKTGLIGYSMGGYGALNTTGAGYSKKAIAFFQSITGGSDALKIRAAGNEAFVNSQDKRIKAVVAFAPWGMASGVWDSVGLSGLHLPTFFVAGSQDDISMYENGIKAIYTRAIHADRYLFTYVNARHNVAPNPAPYESFKQGLSLDEYYRYSEPVWDERRINNVNQHFVTAFLGIYLQGKDYGKYLDLKQNSNDGNWTGFKPRTSVGMELSHDLPINR